MGLLLPIIDQGNLPVTREGIHTQFNTNTQVKAVANSVKLLQEPELASE